VPSRQLGNSRMRRGGFPTDRVWRKFELPVAQLSRPRRRAEVMENYTPYKSVWVDLP
jgi:hypothetical protein